MNRAGYVVRPILNIYLFLLCVVLPLYMRNGYYALGDAKFSFYRAITSAATLLLLPLLRFAPRREMKKYAVLPLIGCCAALFLSFAFPFARDYQTAFWGIDGWRMGLFSQLSFLFLFFVFSRYYMPVLPPAWLLLCGPSLVCLLGFLDRCGLFLLSIDRDPSFLSTIGNVDWYCGYLSVMLPLGAGLLFFSDRACPFFVLRAAAVFLMFLSALSQGGSSILLSLVLLLFFFFAVGLSGRRYFYRFLLLLLLLGLAAEFLCGLQHFLPEVLAYARTEAPTAWILQHTGGGLLLLAAVLFLLSRFFDLCHIRLPYRAAGLLCFLTLLIASCAGLVVLLFFQLCFSLPDPWGNGRGLIWRISATLFHTLTPLRRWVGVGPDLYGRCAYASSELYGPLQAEFAGAYLTNAHSELLTLLINGGIFSVIGYLGFLFYEIRQMGQYICTLLRQPDAGAFSRRDAAVLLCLLCVLSYLIDHTVSFQQILSTPYMFLFLGLGAGALRYDN